VAQKVGVNNAGPVKEDGNTGSATVFTGKIAGKGIVTVYGKNDIWYLVSSGNAVPTSFDQEKLKNVVQLSITGANVESVELPALDKLTQFSFNNSAVKTVDVSKVPTLTSLTINNMNGIPQLESIDVSKNTELNSISIQGNATTSGQLASIDLSKNTKLTGIYLQYNKLTSITLPSEYTTLNNKGVPAKITLSLNNNELSEIKDLDKVPEKSIVNISSNKFTFATLPAQTSNIKTYTYAPQADMEVEPQGAVLDLKALGTVQDKPTKFEFAAGETALKATEDYKETLVAEFEFLKSFEGVVCTMTSEAFPKLTLKTKPFNVTVSAPAEGRTWDFTTWGAETVNNLKADAAASKITGWSDVEKQADADADGAPTETSKDNCFWLASESTKANGKDIKEIEGLVWNTTYTKARSLAIAVNYPSALSDYAGGAYLWLGGGSKKVPCFTIPGVKAGQTITMEVESHKTSDARGIELYTGVDADGLVDAATKIGDSFTPKTKDSHTWTIDKDCDVIVYNTSGCHIYSIVVK
jgi:hypothetical protein